MVQLGYTSESAKTSDRDHLLEDLRAILDATRPRVVHIHNLADKHPTHVSVALTALRAMRMLPRAHRPEVVLGCEVWRDLDWLGDGEKILQDLTGHDALAAALTVIFESQIDGKRYDLAVMARGRANATFFQSHAVDGAEALSFAMDLTPLARDESLDVVGYVTGAIDRFREDVATKLRHHLDS